MQKPLPRGTYFIMGLITVYLMTYNVFPSELTAIFAVALPILFTWFFLRYPPLSIALGAIAATVLFSTGSLTGAAAIVASLVVIGMGAAAILHLKPWISILLGMAAYGIAFAVTGDPAESLCVFQLIPCAIVLAILMARGVNRVPTVCAVSASLLVMAAIPVALSIYREYGELSSAVLSTLIDAIRTQAIDAYHVSVSLLPEEMRSAMTEEVFHSAFDAIVVLSPAIAVIVSNLLAFFAHWLTLLICQETGYAKKLSLGTRLFVMSKMSAVVFIVALLIPLLGAGNSDDLRVITVAAENINLMLLPAFLFVGSLSVIAFFRRQRGCLNFWILLAVVSLLIYAGSFIIYPLALLGAIRTLKTPRHFPN